MSDINKVVAKHDLKQGELKAVKDIKATKKFDVIDKIAQDEKLSKLRKDM